MTEGEDRCERTFPILMSVDTQSTQIEVLKSCTRYPQIAPQLTGVGTYHVHSPANTRAVLASTLLTSCFHADFIHRLPVWLKIDQFPQRLMYQGLRPGVLSLSTGRCTVDVGNCARRCRSTMRLPALGICARCASVSWPRLQDNSSTADPGQLALKGLNLLGPQSN